MQCSHQAKPYTFWNMSPRKALKPCYVCGKVPVGLMRRMPACSACRKFITRHRFTPLSSLRCDGTGYGCDMTKTRPCAKCRLRRSMDLNPQLKREIESNLPNAAQLTADNHESHMASLATLRHFLARKDPQKSEESSHNSDQSEASGRRKAASPENVTDIEEDVSTLENPIHSNIVNQNFTSTSSQLVANEARQELQLDSAPTNTDADATPNVNFNQLDPNNADDGWDVIITAVNCIPQTYQIFVLQILEKLKQCTPDECLLILPLISEHTGLYNIEDNAYSKQDMWSALILYSAMVMNPSNVSAENIAATIRTNPCFAYLTKCPLKMMSDWLNQMRDN